MTWIYRPKKLDAERARSTSVCPVSTSNAQAARTFFKSFVSLKLLRAISRLSGVLFVLLFCIGLGCLLILLAIADPLSCIGFCLDAFVYEPCHRLASALYVVICIPPCAQDVVLRISGVAAGRVLGVLATICADKPDCVLGVFASICAHKPEFVLGVLASMHWRYICKSKNDAGAR